MDSTWQGMLDQMSESPHTQVRDWNPGSNKRDPFRQLRNQQKEACWLLLPLFAALKYKGPHMLLSQVSHPHKQSWCLREHARQEWQGLWSTQAAEDGVDVSSLTMQMPPSESVTQPSSRGQVGNRVTCAQWPHTTLRQKPQTERDFQKW